MEIIPLAISQYWRVFCWKITKPNSPLLISHKLTVISSKFFFSGVFQLDFWNTTYGPRVIGQSDLSEIVIGPAHVHSRCHARVFHNRKLDYSTGDYHVADVPRDQPSKHGNILGGF